MKKLIVTLLLITLPVLSASAHYLWIETNGNGKLGQKQEIRVHYGEYTYGVIEKVKGEAFPLVSKFTLWVIAPDGTKTELSTEAKEDHYLASFTPSKNGVYTIALNNNEIDVIDYTEYDFGIFKTHYHSTAKVLVGTDGDTKTVNPEGIVVKQLENDGEEIKLQVVYKGKPLAKNELKVYVSDLWSKTLYTDDNGEVSFALPWNTKYIVETTTKEEIPGTYNGDDYEFIWHCATYCIKR
ncbi:DUF4198 domain-containing protein [Flagellimonas halotolerans]|uniref:DUF4198 domain-containing protein n=1 Tax=Flagellimonas halotolerans TaxID=3112164 RepID=A0ABU6IP91_9FLAO|nr:MULTISPECIES: DUF4198 domain-containing protein [unclassified Allomuricauda]MEC3965227.1 DUF4198 domain-containing protein [Muricauda sp. SYSU M86414]MEC4264928.1 DUF4198 domain-containing protein [Muricauda sp. SYSU M84420]